MRWKHWTVLFISADGLVELRAMDMALWSGQTRCWWPSKPWKYGLAPVTFYGPPLFDQHGLAGRWRPLRKRPLSQMAKANISDHQHQAFGRSGCK